MSASASSSTGPAQTPPRSRTPPARAPGSSPPGLSPWKASIQALARAVRLLARSAELPAYIPVPQRPLAHASGLALLMLAAATPDSTVGWLIVSREIALLASSSGACTAPEAKLERTQQIETELSVELDQIATTLERERPRTGEVLEADAQAAKRAREPLPPPARDPGRQETEDVKRLIGPLRGRKRPRWR